MKTVITTHKNMDLDALGALVAAKKLYPDSVVILPDTKDGCVSKLLSENPEIVEFAKESTSMPENVGRVVVVDTNKVERIPDNVKKLIETKRIRVVIYDHHSSKVNGENVKINYKPVGSTTSMMALLLKGRGIIPSPLEASVMLAGIYADTGTFRFPSTTPLDFLAAAYLLSAGANVEFVKEYLTSELSTRELDILKILKDNLKTTEIHGNSVGITYGRFDSYVGDIAHLVSKLLEISGLPTIIAAVEVGETVFLIGRSRTSKVDVSKIVAAFGGGGHPQAASASIKGRTVFEVIRDLQTVLETVAEPLKRAKDIMTSPPIVVAEECSVKDARTLLMKNSINAAPVVDSKGRIAGIVNRVLLDKAFYMGLENEIVSEVMERDFPYLLPESNLSDVERIIVERHQTFVPVVKNGKPVGVITRTDILMNLYRDEISTSAGFYRKRILSSPKYRNVARTLLSHLPENLLSYLKEVGKIADEAGLNVYIVGGFVRDLIMGRKNFDVDVVVEGDATEFAKKVAKQMGAKVHTFARFKTATVVFPSGFRIDFASARTEIYRAPGALPEVDMAPLKKDLMRRDFTINTLAVKLNRKEFGKLIDFFGGLKDIRDRKIRVLHSLSFVEDPTRILRALRFATRYRLDLGKHTEKLLKIAVQKKFFKTVEGQRIYHELKQIFLEDNPLRTVNHLDYYGVLSSLFPTINWNRKKKDFFERSRKIVIWHKLNFPEMELKYYLLYFGALLTGQSYREVNSYLEELAVPERDKKIIKELLQSSPYILKELDKRKENSEVFKLLNKFSEESLLFAAALTEDEEKRENILQYLRKWRFIKPAVNGMDLKSLGLRPGPTFKRVLNELKYKIIDAKISEDREEQLEFIKDMIRKEEGNATE